MERRIIKKKNKRRNTFSNEGEKEWKKVRRKIGKYE